MNSKEVHELKEHPDLKRSQQPPDLFHVSLQSTFFIGMDVIKQKPVVTDRNPNLGNVQLTILNTIFKPFESAQIGILNSFFDAKKILRLLATEPKSRVISSRAFEPS